MTYYVSSRTLNLTKPKPLLGLVLWGYWTLFIISYLSFLLADQNIQKFSYKQLLFQFSFVTCKWMFYFYICKGHFPCFHVSCIIPKVLAKSSVLDGWASGEGKAMWFWRWASSSPSVFYAFTDDEVAITHWRHSVFGLYMSAFIRSSVCVYIHVVVRSNSCKNVVLWGCGRLRGSVSYFLTTRSSIWMLRRQWCTSKILAKFLLPR